MSKSHRYYLTLVTSLLMFFSAGVAQAQRGLTPPAVSRSGNFSISGDLEVTGKETEDKILTFDVMLYSRTGMIRDRQRLGSKGRFRFNNVELGDYDIVVEFENTEVYREHVKLTGVATDFRQNIGFELRLGSSSSPKPATISAADVYERHAPNKDRFEKAQEAFDKKDYAKAATLFLQVVGDDPQDFQAWSELGTVFLVQKNFAEAEKSYLHATGVRPTFFRALFNLGRVRLMQKNYEGAVTALEQAVAVQPRSAEANYFLGEAYLQIKKGSKAVGCFYEALKLDPTGMAEAHLRLAALYNGAGLKQKAAAEYEEFLKKKPSYADRKKLEEYIAANKASQP